MRIAIIIIFLLIIFNLISALYYLLRANEQSHYIMVRALAFRVGISLCLFFTLIFAYYQGWIVPSGKIVV
jgi:hypothetical protein